MRLGPGFSKMAAQCRGRLSFHFQRRLYSALAAEQSQLPQTGVPIIVAPHVIKKAYIVHPTTKVMDPCKKAQWLTKTTIVHSLPPAVCKLGEFFQQRDVNLVKDALKSSVIQKFAFQKEGTRNKASGKFQEELRLGVLTDLLRVFWSLAERFPHLRDSYIDCEPSIMIHWARNHNFFQLKHNPSLILRTKEPLPLFERDIDWTTDATLPGPYDTYSLGVFRHPIVHLRNFPGYHHSNHNPYPHPHTILQQNTLGIAPDQLQSHGLLSMFSVLVSQAREQGIKLGEHLNQPLTTKCIVTNGIEYLFMCYQLNTLSMQEEHGIKNIAWTSNLQCVAKRKNNFPKNKVAFYECLPQALQESQFSEECFRNLVSFMCQETQ